MNAEWRDDLATGNETIDNQHKELFRRIDSLLLSAEERKNRTEVENLLLFLIDYVKIHFSDEEALQLQHAYPLYKEHREEHDIFIRKLMQAADQFYTEESPHTVNVIAGNMALQWLLNHIYKSDKKMAEYVNSKLMRGSIGT